MTKNFKLTETLKGVIPFFKSAQGDIKVALIQSLIIYGAAMLLTLAAFGPEAELFRVGVSVATEFFLEASILVFLTRRLVLKDLRKSEWLDLHLKLPEVKVMGIQLLGFLLMTLLALGTRFVGLAYESFSDKVESFRWVMVALTVSAILALIVAMIFLRLRLYLVSVFIADQQKGVFKGSWTHTKGIIFRMMWVPFLALLPWFLLSRLEGLLLAPLMEGSTIGAYIGRSLSDILIQLCQVIPSALTQIYLYLLLVKGSFSPALLSDSPQEIPSVEA